MLGYSNDLNPFGDSNLLTPFVWEKKKEGKQGKKSKKKHKHGSDHDVESDHENKRIELLSEIEKVSKRRQDRENELAEIERLRDEEQRLREMASFGDWQRKEEDFHLEQTKERTKLRALKCHEKYMDTIVRNLLLVETGQRVLQAKAQNMPIDSKDIEFLSIKAELSTPFDIIMSISNLSDLQQLEEELNAHEELDEHKTQHQHLLLWSALRTISLSHRSKLSHPTGEALKSSALHASIVGDVSELLKGKTTIELDALEAEIRLNLQPNQAIDVEYWELLLDEVLLQRAKGYIASFHRATLQQWVDIRTALHQVGVLSNEDRSHDQGQRSQRQASHQSQSVDDLFAQQYIKDAVEREGGNDDDDDDSDAEGRIRVTTSIEETALPAMSYAWGDKFYPRKPRYFNRVRTGWDRTKYNLAHYDRDNPPPKVIQGYKFTIFYPDLLDTTQTPSYKLEACSDESNNEFVVIRFVAGPPYEDIAFKVLNKQWDRHRYAGYLCIFDRGVLQLNFNFKRVFYRR